MRFAMYVGGSTALAAGVVLSAFTQRPNFYSATVYIAQSNACLLVLTNFFLLLTGLFVYGLQKVFYGPLRAVETEQLYEKAWFAVTETCLAMTIFRDEFGAWFLVMFVSLLVGKVWSWIGEGRVEVLEQQPPANPRLFHTRLTVSLAMSLIYDISMLNFTINTVLRMAKPDMMVVFAFEFAVLAINSVSMALRYALWATEKAIVGRQTRQRMAARRQELIAERQQARLENPDIVFDTPEVEVDEMDIEVPGWDEKGQWMFAIDIATDFLKLIVYLGFFFILLFFYGLPIHIVRDVFLTFRSFFKRIRDFMRYRKATKDMDARYPDATPEEVENAELCIICREEMRPFVANERATPAMDLRSHPKKLPCGHILHFGCLRSWLERQQVCPTCRRPVVGPSASTILNANNQVPNQPAPPAPGALPVPPQNGAAHAPLAPTLPAPGPPGAQPRMQERVLNFGPVRIGMAYGRLPAGAVPGYAGNGPTPTVDPRTATQVHLPVAHQNIIARRPVSESIRSRLRAMEEEIQREMRNLDTARMELHILQQAQEQLDMLRAAAAAGSSDSTPTSTSVPLNSGDPNLPPGVSIPPGWTLIPLQHTGSAPNGSIPVAESSSEQPAAEADPSTADKGKTVVRDPPSEPTPVAATTTGVEAVSPTESITHRHPQPGSLTTEDDDRPTTD